MSLVSKFQYLWEETRVFYRNITKDNQEKRKDPKVLQHKLAELERLECELTELKSEFNKQQNAPDIVSQVKEFCKGTESKISESRKILSERVENLSTTSDTAKMSEKFDLKCATSLLPRMNGTEDVTKQLIDAIEMYSELLDENGQELLINFVLKTRLSQSAKLRLNKSYSSVKELLADMVTSLLTKRSAATLASELHRAHQSNKTVEEYGRSIEELLVNLTIAQASGDDKTAETLTKVNEKLAVNVFSNGLRDRELRTIVKARNCEFLKDAIMVAKEEETSRASAPAHQFHMKKKRQNSKTHFRRKTYQPNSWQAGGRKQYKNDRQQNNTWKPRPRLDQHTFTISGNDTAKATYNKNDHDDKFFRGQPNKKST